MSHPIPLFFSYFYFLPVFQRYSYNFGRAYKRKHVIYIRQQFKIIYNYKYSLLNTLTTPKMTNSYLTLIPQQHSNQHRLNLNSLYDELMLTEDAAKIDQLTSLIFSYMNRAQDIEFETSLHLLLKIFSKGCASSLFDVPDLIKRIMSHFVKLSKEFKKQPNLELHYRILFVLSIIAELIRQEPKSQMPFTRQFLQQIFQIQSGFLEIKEEQSKLLAILGVIFSNLSMNVTLLKQLKIGQAFKQAILQNYSFIEQSYSLKLFNQAILQLQIKRIVVFTFNELVRYGIKDALVKSMPNSNDETVMKYLKKIFPLTNNKSKQIKTF